jgi:poly(3-hydroxybutyrate) depolymerase
MEDPSGTICWDSFLAGDFIPHLRSACNVSDSTVMAGISGGGYGALKLAFTHPHLFAAVAAMQPMLEPGLRESDVGPRNRLHRSAGGPPQLINRPHTRCFALGVKQSRQPGSQECAAASRFRRGDLSGGR